jgi:hypothetical protein
MGTFGAGGIIEVIGHALRGPAHTFQYVLVERQPDGSKIFTGYKSRDTIKTALRGRGKTTYTGISKASNMEPCRLVALSSWDKAHHSDTHMLLPLNKDGHVVFTNGRVYDLKTKKMLRSRDADIVDYAMVAPTFGRRLKWLASSPSILIRLVVIAVLGLVIDSLACVLAYRHGEKHGYKKALKGQVPVNSASDLEPFGPSAPPFSHPSEAGWLLASALSPFPLQALPSTHYVYPSNPQLSAQIQQTAASNWIKRHGSPPPYQAIPPYPPPPYQTTPPYPPPAYQATQPSAPPQQLVG